MLNVRLELASLGHYCISIHSIITTIYSNGFKNTQGFFWYQCNGHLQSSFNVQCKVSLQLMVHLMSIFVQGHCFIIMSMYYLFKYNQASKVFEECTVLYIVHDASFLYIVCCTCTITCSQFVCPFHRLYSIIFTRINIMFNTL